MDPGPDAAGEPVFEADVQIGKGMRTIDRHGAARIAEGRITLTKGNGDVVVEAPMSEVRADKARFSGGGAAKISIADDTYTIGPLRATRLIGEIGRLRYQPGARYRPLEAGAGAHRALPIRGRGRRRPDRRLLERAGRALVRLSERGEPRASTTIPPSSYPPIRLARWPGYHRRAPFSVAPHRPMAGPTSPPTDARTWSCTRSSRTTRRRPGRPASNAATRCWRR